MHELTENKSGSLDAATGQPNHVFTPESLGNPAIRAEYGIKYAYFAGGMYRAIASKELVVRLGKAGMMGFLGTAALAPGEIRDALRFIQSELVHGEAYGMNLICNLVRPEIETETISIYLEHRVTRIEASAFIRITPALVLFRLAGLRRDAGKRVVCGHKIMAKLSRSEVAEAFMSPAPERIVSQLLASKLVTQEQADLSREVPMSFDICVEADSGGHTDQGIPTVLLPSIQSLRRELSRKFGFAQDIRIGLAGGIGTPEAAAAAFIMGADFILTGSINQCTVEAGMSESVKDVLQEINVHDTAYAPAGDMFEIGAKVQVLKKGVFFPARANKLYMLYSQYDSIEELPVKIRTLIERQYFKKSLEEIWEETKEYFDQHGYRSVVEKAEKNPKQKLALVFRSYFGYSMQLAFAGDEANRVDYQVHTGPALGAFNQWVKGTKFENWRNRHVDQIGEMLMCETAALLTRRFEQWRVL
jgi:trans-AT polyketide synthase/acyltransferase/oxidoreductase domain-containing protein